MKIYVAHNFAARLALRVELEELAKLHEITSNWIYDDSHVAEKSARVSAGCDINDIDRSDALMLFIDQFGECGGKGKWWEWGYAFAKRKLIFLIGADKSCVFYHARRDGVFKFVDFAAFMRWLNLLEKGDMELVMRSMLRK